MTILPFNVIKEPSGIYAVLNTVIHHKVRFRVKLNNRGKSFNSSLIKIESSYLIADALFPFEGNSLIRDSKFITVNFIIDEAEHIPFTFNSAYIQDLNINGYPAIKIAFPDSIERDQKRLYHRVAPSVSEDVYVEFSLDGQCVKEKAANISGGGIGFYTNLGKSVLWAGKKLAHVSLNLNDFSVTVGIVVINIMRQAEYPVLINGKAYYYYCGAEFTDIDENTRNKIIGYVIENERKELKRQNREFE